MGWNPSNLGKDEYLILSTQGGIRAEDGSPIALGYHTRELNFPQGVFLMTSACPIPDGEFTLQPEDVVVIEVGELKIDDQDQT